MLAEKTFGSRRRISTTSDSLSPSLATNHARGEGDEKPNLMICDRWLMPNLEFDLHKKRTDVTKRRKGVNQVGLLDNWPPEQKGCPLFSLPTSSKSLSLRRLTECWRQGISSQAGP
jgi:hypothetical protein